MSKFTHKRKQAFLQALAEGASPSRAAKAAGWSRTASYRYRQENPEFDAECTEAMEEGTDLLEDVVLDLGVKGAREDVWYQGIVVGQRYKLSENALFFTLRARRPGKYRESIKPPADDGQLTEFAQAVNGSLPNPPQEPDQEEGEAAPEEAAE